MSPVDPGRLEPEDIRQPVPVLSGQERPFAAALSLIFTAAVIGVVAGIGVLSRRYMRGVDAA